MKKVFCFLFLTSFLVPVLAISKPFANNFMEFNLPDSWQCVPESEDWVCQDMNPQIQKEAIIALSFRTQGRKDELQSYFDYLSKPILIEGASGIKSVPQYTKFKTILGQEWVDSQHSNSFVSGYITRYLATIKNARSILLSVTIDESKYNVYMPLLYNLIESIRIRTSLPQAPMVTEPVGLLGRLKELTVGAKSKKTITGVPVEEEAKKDYTTHYLIGGLLVLVILYIIVKVRSKKKRKGGKSLLR